MFLEILVLVGSIFLIVYFRNRKQAHNLPPGPIAFPIIGNMPQLFMMRHLRHFDSFHQLSQKYGSPIISVSIGPIRQVIVEDHKLIREILHSDVWMDRFFTDFLSERSFRKELGVLTSNGGRGWKEMRRFSLRTLREFGFGKQKSMEETLEYEIEDLMKTLSKRLENENNIIEIKGFFIISVLNILWNMIAGYRFDRNDERLHSLLHLLDELVKVTTMGSQRTAAVIAFPILRVIDTNHLKVRSKLFSSVQQFFREILNERRSEGDYKEEQRDFIDVFLKEIDNHAHTNAADIYTDEQFIIMCQDLFMAGSETSSNIMEFAVLYMILNPDVQRKVQAEIDRVVGQNRLPSNLDRPNMPYTEATVLEIQRLGNTVPVIFRSPIEDTTLGGYNVPKGTVGVINLYSMHMNETEFNEPHQFNPNRFLDTNGNVINASKILPFGSGKRSCLGEVLAKTSMFMFFTSFLQRYTFELPPNHPTPTIEPVVGLTLSPKPYSALIKHRF